MTSAAQMLTPDQAARRAGCGRSSIMRALISGQLHGLRHNTGRWRIAAEELDRWRSNRPASDHDQSGQRPDRPDMTGQVEALRQERDEARIEAARSAGEASQLRERVDELRAERDHWRTLAERLTEPRPGLLDRLLGLLRR